MNLIKIIIVLVITQSAFSRVGVVFIPGLVESHLRTIEDKQRRYLNAWELWSSHTLAIDSPELQIENTEPLEPDGVLHYVEIYGLASFMDFSQSLKEELDQLDPLFYDVHYFDYDWRQPVIQSAAKLQAYLQAQKDLKSWIIVSHSMGGLVTSYFLRYGDQALTPDLRQSWQGLKMVEKVIFAGAPFRGSILTFKEMVRGRKPFGTTNESLLSAEASSSFPSYYDLFPFALKKGILNSSAQTVNASTFTVEKFVQEKWGLMQDRDEIHSYVLESRKNYVSRMIKNAKKFSEALLQDNSNIPQKKIKVMNVLSSEIATLASVIYKKTDRPAYKNILTKKREIKKAGLPETLAEQLYAKGDGTVVLASAKLPKWIEQITSFRKVITTEKSHPYLYKDPEVIKEVLEFIKVN